MGLLDSFFEALEDLNVVKYFRADKKKRRRVPMNVRKKSKQAEKAKTKLAKNYEKVYGKKPPKRL